MSDATADPMPEPTPDRAVGELSNAELTNELLYYAQMMAVTDDMTKRLELLALRDCHYWEVRRRQKRAEQVTRISVRLFDCLCEFEDDPTACGEWQEAWDDAVISYKRAASAGERDDG